MPKRRIKITTTSDKVGEVVERLSGSSIEVSVVVDMPETKENFEFLSKSDSITSWDFGEVMKEPCSNCECSSKKELVKSSINCILKEAGIDTITVKPDEVLKLIECVWELKKHYPSLHYTESNIARALNSYYSDELGGSDATGYLITKRVLTDFIGGYNSAYLDKSKIYPELIDRLGEVWDNLGKFDTLSGLVYMIYDINILGSAQGAR
jgi:hypothetical protein